MALISENELKNKIKSCPTGAYLIFGDEDYLKKIYIDKIIKATVEDDFSDFNLHVFDGKTVTLSEIYDSVEAFPMMSESTCVLVNDMQLDSLDDDSFAMFKDIINDVPDTCALVFCIKTINTSGKSWSKVFQLFEECATLVKLEKKEANDIIKTIESAAKRRGSFFDNDVAKYFIDCVGNDLNTLHNELEKLCAYAYKRKIIRSDVDSICTKSLEAKVFDIMKVLHNGKFELAMTKLSTVISQKEDPIKILGAFITSYIDIYRAKSAVSSGLISADAAKYYDYQKKSFRLDNAIRDSKGLSLHAVRECIEILSDADDLLKGSDVDKVIILEQTLSKLAVAEGESRR